jgi:type IV pilus assembly protein PilB
MPTTASGQGAYGIIPLNNLLDQFHVFDHHVQEKDLSFLSQDAPVSLNDNDAPIIKFMNQILIEAIQKGASDIHFEPYENQYRIRYRQDGLLTEVAAFTLNLSNRISSRLKVMAKLDIAERRLPQDGRFQMKYQDQRIDFRVSTCPTINGEKVVVRLLDTDLTHLAIDTLGLNPLQKECFLSHLQKPQGLILVTGPTGSGKTVTLYTALKILNTIDKNISTAEDPVEIKLPGINQVNINPKSGLEFSTILRSFLRQDPDILMIGEVRDLETAEIAINAAQTGHLVLSTLHTNNAAETLTRLSNLGVPACNMVNSLTLLVAQRLARRLCDYCKMRQGEAYCAVGCQHCVNGYRGRIGLFEVIPVSKRMGQLIFSGGNSLDILKHAQSEGFISIYQSGLEKVKLGLTTFEEVKRVTMD